MSLLLLLNPKQYGGAVERDTSDILDVYRRKKRAYDELEEQIAAELLKKRRTDVVIPDNVDPDRLSKVLAAKIGQQPKVGEVSGDERKKRIKLLLLAISMDDDL